MERLTEDYNDSYCLKKCYPNNDSFCDGDGRGCPIDNCGVVIEALNKLGEYEKAEEQGLLVRLPCPIGTTVYDICGMDIRENVLSEVEKTEDDHVCREFIIHPNGTISGSWNKNMKVIKN